MKIAYISTIVIGNSLSTGNTGGNEVIAAGDLPETVKMGGLTVRCIYRKDVAGVPVDAELLEIANTPLEAGETLDAYLIRLAALIPPPPPPPMP